MRIIQSLGFFVLMLALVFLVACTQEPETHADMNHPGHSKMENQVAATVGAWNKVCPVQGGEIDPEFETVSFDGKAYGFCCLGCDETFSADPAKYAARLNKDGTELLEM